MAAYAPVVVALKLGRCDVNQNVRQVYMCRSHDTGIFDGLTNISIKLSQCLRNASSDFKPPTNAGVTTLLDRLYP